MPTDIFTIHGVPQNELPDRGKMVRARIGYVPYTNLTKGEAKLFFLAKQAQIYADAFPENQEYQQAAGMLQNALRAGVSNGVNFVGALYAPLLQQVAKEIAAASRQTAPASKGMLLGRDSISQGIQGIGENKFQFNFEHDCVKYATQKSNAFFGMNKSWTWWKNQLLSGTNHGYWLSMKKQCETRVAIEGIVNSRMLDASHHVLYFGLNEAFPPTKGTAVVTKHLLHLGGIQGLANATDTDRGLMGLWSETSILEKNTMIEVGPVGSVPSSFYLAPDPDSMLTQYNDFIKNRLPGGGIHGIGSLAAVTALIAAITASIKAAADFAASLNARKANAMSAAQNYGTAAFAAAKSDFNTSGGQSSNSSNNGLLWAAAAAAGYFLLTDN